MAKKTSTKKPQDKKTSAKKSTGSKKKLATKAAGAETAEATAPKEAKVKKPAIPRGKLAPRTFFPQHGELGKWKLIDAANMPLGRLSSYIAQVLMGKHTPAFTRHSDAGDFVVVINAEKVALSGNKWRDKLYQYHTNFPGGLKTLTAQNLKDSHPDRLIRWAVWGMLPKSKGHMARRWYKKLHVFAGDTHEHTAQKPELMKLPNLGIRENA